MEKNKFLYITHLSGKRINRLWISALQAANELGFEVHLACNMSEIEPEGWAQDCRKYEVITHQIDFNRNPLNRENIRAGKQLLELMQKEKFAIVHCNTPIGGVLGRICAKKASVSYVIYQAHGFHFWKGAPLKNWLLYYPVERFLSRWTDVLILINKEDYERAKGRFYAKKILYVPGVGIDTKKFHSGLIDMGEKRKELGLKPDEYMLLSVGELSERKNHEIVIRALSKIDNKKFKYFIVGMGELKNHLAETIKNLNLSENVFLLGYRTDISELCQTADVFIFPSYQEGLPVALMEAMATGLPCIATNIRGNVDLIEDGKGGYLCNPRDANEFAEKINELSDCRELRSKMGTYNMEKVKEFDEKIIKKRMKEIYSEVEK